MVNYAILGGGRLARHFSRYFHLLEIPHTRWARDHHASLNTFEDVDAETRLRKSIDKAGCILLLVSDQAIPALLEQYPFLHGKRLVHCSGALNLPSVTGAHPLMTFAEHLYELDTYQSIPFMLDAGQDFADVFPDLPNPHFSIKTGDRARYHAMCVSAGNFSQVLWKGIADRFEQDLGLPAETLHPYLKQVAENFIQTPESALTGPLARGDQKTIERNLDSLDGDPLQDLYRAFILFYQDGGTRRPVSKQARMEKAV
jgi:predicted short-subunit dehydrogenase-like oxidoreductase (DUF2520 family)